MLLPDIIKQKIQENGPISFHEFMEMALYYPEKGYYNAAAEKIGAKGDFFTSSSVTPAFGATIANKLQLIWESLGKQPFTVVEYGAGNGMLCRDILNFLQANTGMYAQLHYCIIEKSESLRKKQQVHLTEKVSWYNNIGEIGEINGCILSNELLDNFSVHQVVMQDELLEVFVNYEAGFTEIFQPASREILSYFKELNIHLPKGFRTEINLEAINWMKEIASALKSGNVITIDYGFTSAELYHERRKEGTLTCYHKHTVNSNPYDFIGEQDITAHVNFSALIHYGAVYGLHCDGLFSQAEFLLQNGFKQLLCNMLDTGANLLQAAKKEASISYTLLVDMGTKFKVLTQSKGIGHVSN